MFTIYGAEYCGYCSQAKKLLIEQGYEVEYKDIGNPVVRDEMLQRAPSTKSIPQIFLGEYHVGGFTQLQNVMSTGALSMLVEMHKE